MTAPVALDLGCCPAGSGVAGTVRGRGGKAPVVRARTPQDVAVDGGQDPEGWVGRVARLVGLHPAALAAGCPVPLAHHLLTWAAVRAEVEADRGDVVVVEVAPAEVAGLVEAPDVLLRTLDARLDDLAPGVGADPDAASAAAELLALRPELVGLGHLAAAAAAVGHPAQHGPCRRPGSLGLPTVDADDPIGRPRPAVTVRAQGEAFVWQLDLPATGSAPEGTTDVGAQPPALSRSGERLLVRHGDQQRTFRLPAALARCRVRAATVGADRLELLLERDPDAWR